MRFDELPPADQAAVRSALRPGGSGKARRPSPSRAGSTSAHPLTCHVCAEPFERWGVAVERHRDATGHRRYDLVLRTVQGEARASAPGRL